MPRGILFIDNITGELKYQGIFDDPSVVVCNSDGYLAVDNIQGFPVSSSSPTENQVLMVNGSQYIPTNSGYIASQPFQTTEIDFPVESSDTTVLTVPSDPTGNGTFVLTKILIRLTTGVSGEGTVTIRAGSSLGGDEIITDTAVSNSTSIGIIAGLATNSLGTDMDEANNFQKSCNAGQLIRVRCTVAGSISAGTIKVYVYGFMLP